MEKEKSGWRRRIVERDIWIDPWDINLRPEEDYQRKIEIPRLNRVRQWVEKDGYQPDNNIILNPNRFPVDGQHRTKIAREKGIPKVKCSIYEYETVKDEWDHYIELNNSRTNLSPLDEWHAKRGTGDPTAELLYKLANDPECFLYHKLNLRGLENGKYNYSAGRGLDLICRATGLRSHWQKKIAEPVNERVKKYEYREICNIVNLQLDWIQRTFGEYSKTNKDPYEVGTFRALMGLYWEFHNQHFFNNTRSIDTVDRRMKTFNDWKAIRLSDNQTSKIILLGSHYNKQGGRSAHERKLKFHNL